MSGRTDVPDFADWFRRQLDDLGIGVAEAARQSRLGHATISGYRDGSRLPTRPDVVRKLAVWLGVSPDFIHQLVEQRHARAESQLTDEELLAWQADLAFASPEDVAWFKRFGRFTIDEIRRRQAERLNDPAHSNTTSA